MIQKGRAMNLRDRMGFGWIVSCGMPAYGTLAGIRYDLLFHDADAIIEAYRKGKPAAMELFGPDVSYGGPGLAGISYGHINCLGAELIFPEDSEVAHRPIYRSLEEGIQALRRDIDFSTAGLMPFYLRLRERLKAAFPQEKIFLSAFSAEGPLTTGWALRGHDFFTDLIENPDAAKEYLGCVTESIIAYRRFVQRVDGLSPSESAAVGLCDDVSAMVSPRLWPELVMPYLERYYAGQSARRRTAHIEDLRVEHLHFLDELQLAEFDPSVSPRLTPALIRDNCSVPFNWRLNCMQLRDMPEEAIRDWVFSAAADGASRVTLAISRTMCTPAAAARVRAFISAAKEAKAILDSGKPREALHARTRRD